MSRQPMSVRLVVATCVAIGTAAMAWAQDPGGAKPTPTQTLKLGGEFDPPPPHEGPATDKLAELMRGVLEKQVEAKKADPAKAKDPIQRDQHPKHHGCVRAKFAVAEGLPKNLRVGLFAQPQTYDAVIRFSNGASAKDNVPDARGMAIKLVGVEGPSLLPGAEDAGTQDFILIAHPIFFVVDPKGLLEFLGAVRQAIPAALKAGDTAKAEAIKKQVEAPSRIVEDTLNLAFPIPSPLEMTYHSQTPYRLGKGQAVKYEVRPDPSNKMDLPPNTKESDPGALRKAMIARLERGKKPVTFTFRVHVQADPVKMPVEDPTQDWGPESITVATITIPPQEFAREDQLTFCEDLSYTPWHATEPHRPIGGINRARKKIYEEISKFRHRENGVERKEPTRADLDRLFPTYAKDR